MTGANRDESCANCDSPTVDLGGVGKLLDFSILDSVPGAVAMVVDPDACCRY